MEKESNEAKFTIEGNPGTGNTFINIGTAYNVNPNATKVENVFNMGLRDDCNAAVAEAMGGMAGGKKLGAMTLREMLRNDLIDTGTIQKEILNYVSRIRSKLKKDMDKRFETLWSAIVVHDAFAIDLYDPGKQQCTFNRNLVANIIHYLDSKGFYEGQYSAAAMTRALEAGEDQHPVRSALGKEPDTRYRKVVDDILEDISA